MASDKNFIDWICDQARRAGLITTKKMFGEHMIYCDAKPVLLVCDNTPFVKILPETAEMFENTVEMLKLLARILPAPTPKKRKRPAG